MKPKYDTALIKINELKKEIESLQNTAAQQEEIQRTLYMQLYAKQKKSEKSLVRATVILNYRIFRAFFR